MDNEHLDAQIGASDSFAPILDEGPRFSARKQEILAALVMFVLAYCYTGMWLDNWCAWLAAFTLGFLCLTEYLYKGTRRSAESWIWLGCVLVILVSMIFPAISVSRLLGIKQTQRVWNTGDSALFLHVFAVYWVLCRSGRLCGGESGRLLPLDGLNGFIIFPFKHFFLRIRTLLFGLKQLKPQKSSAKPARTAAVIIAILVAVGLFTMAAKLLGEADSGFSALTEKFFAAFRIQWNEEVILRIVLSLPIGAYLFGLLAGTGREMPEVLQSKGERILRAVGALRWVPDMVWIAVLAIFSALYAAFFFLQGTYLFGAFTRTLPEGFVVSQYAREGFFELCKIMAVNFALLWCVTRSSSRPVQENRTLLAMCTALLTESMIFAVIALSKLALYIDCFGFTPLRLESSWLVCVLLFGCACSLVTLISRKKTFRIWMIFGGITLALLHLY